MAMAWAALTGSSRRSHGGCAPSSPGRASVHLVDLAVDARLHHLGRAHRFISFISRWMRAFIAWAALTGSSSSTVDARLHRLGRAHRFISSISRWTRSSPGPRSPDHRSSRGGCAFIAWAALTGSSRDLAVDARLHHLGRAHRFLVISRWMRAFIACATHSSSRSSHGGCAFITSSSNGGAAARRPVAGPRHDDHQHDGAGGEPREQFLIQTSRCPDGAGEEDPQPVLVTK
jgi:hypothetical protein